MGYTVISQNNTTTTLQDENGNIVHVPAKTVLATSTEYEISEVNNSTATLTSSDGKVIRGIPCVAVLSGGGGGGDQHNLGWYATESALTTAHPTASNGDWAIVGATDTVWVWDSDTTAWKDTDTKGQVTSVNGQTGAVTVDALPSQTGQSGKFLTTNGTDASWTSSLQIGNAVKVSNSSTTMGSLSVVVGGSASATQNGAIAIGYGSDSSAKQGVAVGSDSAVASTYGCAYGYGARIGNSATHAIQMGSTGSVTTNSDANTLKVANANGNFELMSADGTIPEARLADTTNAQQGDVLTLDANGDAVWQAGGGGSSYTAGTGIDITSGVISVTSPTLQNTATGTDSLTINGVASTTGYNVNIGVGSEARSQSVCVGAYSKATGSSSVSVRGTATGESSIAIRGTASGGYSVAIGGNAKAAGAIQLGSTLQPGATAPENLVANTFKVANANGNYEMMSADGTIPAARHAALPAADGTYTLQLVITDGVPTLSWVAV